MPGSFTILADERFVYTRAWGVVTDEMLHAHVAALAQDPQMSDGLPQPRDCLDLAWPRGAVRTGGSSPPAAGSDLRVAPAGFTGRRGNGAVTPTK